MSPFNPIVTIPSQIVFREPVIKHPKKSTKTNIPVSDLAFHLEKVYKLGQIFYKMYQSKIKSIIIDEVKAAWKHGRDQETVNGIIAEKIQSLWRLYIINQEHGIRTKAAMQEGRQSFVDTGAYYKNMRIALTMDRSKSFGPATLGQYLTSRGRA